MSLEPSDNLNETVLPALVINLERLQEVTSLEPEELSTLTDLYIGQACECIPTLKQRIEAGDLDETNKIAHKLAGSSLSCGLERIGQLFRLIEQACREENLERAQLLALRIDDEFSKVQTAIANLIAGKES